MAKLSFFNDIFREPWMIEPQTAIANRMMVIGVLNGFMFEPEDKNLQTELTHRDMPAIPLGRKVDVVNLTGTMLRDDGACGMIGTRTLAKQLMDTERDDSVIGHILFVDSGGGAANSIPDLAEAIEACEKPVVAYVDGYMCSAAMYAASYCDHIMAHRAEDRVGCIGTMIELSDWPKNVKDSNGMLHIRVYADGAEEKNDEFESALEGNFQLIKERMLNPHNEQFKADIRKNRPSVREDQLKGRTYEAKDAIGTLVDSIGDFEAAVNKVIELSNLTIEKMEGREHLQSLDSCHDLQTVDGTVTLNEQQLDEIDTTLGAAKTEMALHATDAKTITEQAEKIKQLTEERDTLKSEKEELTDKAGLVDAKDQEIANLTTERDALKEDNAQKDARIKELEESLSKHNDDDGLLAAMHNGNPAKPEDDFKELTDEEAMDFARKVVNGKA